MATKQKWLIVVSEGGFIVRHAVFNSLKSAKAWAAIYAPGAKPLPFWSEA